MLSIAASVSEWRSRAVMTIVTRGVAVDAVLMQMPGVADCVFAAGTWNWCARLLDRVLRHRLLVPADAAARHVGDRDETVLRRQRLGEDRCRPVDVLEPVGGRRD